MQGDVAACSDWNAASVTASTVTDARDSCCSLIVLFASLIQGAWPKATLLSATKSTTMLLVLLATCSLSAYINCCIREAGVSLVPWLSVQAVVRLESTSLSDLTRSRRALMCICKH